jgi:penicillin-binding protein 2
MTLPPPAAKKEIDRTKLRLSVLGVLVFAMFVGLFSRLWFLQVLAKDEFTRAARDNRVRLVYTEPPRGRILDAKNRILVKNRTTEAVAISHTLRREPQKLRKVVKRLSNYLDVPVKTIRENLNNETVSPYKPIPVVTDIKESDRQYILAHQADLFPGISIQDVPIRTYPYGSIGSHVLGWVNEIRKEQLKDPFFKEANVKPKYGPGDIVGQDGVELTYDHFLRGAPGVQKFVVNSAGEVVRSQTIQEESAGADVKLSLDIKVQEMVENMLESGLVAARSHGFPAPAGAAVVMDPKTGGIVAMASLPKYNVAASADGFSEKEWKKINGSKTPNNPDDDAIINRAAQAQRAPGSTFKPITMAAAMATGQATPYTTLPCPGSLTFPPGAEPGAGQQFFNWTTSDLGTTDVPRSLRISCNTFYYQLGWNMEMAYGSQEEFQKYARLMGIGHDTGIDLPYEADGRVPDRAWCEAIFQATKDDQIPTCGVKGADESTWLPGYTVNMAIGQGDLITNPLQMAVAYASIANGGYVLEPRLASEVAFSAEKKKGKQVLKEFEPHPRAELGLDATELGAIQQGLTEVTTHGEGTARGPFSGLPFAVAGKTGTAQLGETGQNDSWFISYGPAEDPQYVVAVYVEKAGHGGETAAPIAREIYEGLLGDDRTIDIQIGEDASG